MRTLLILSLLLTTAAFAQRGGGGMGEEGGGGGRNGGLSIPSIAPRMSRLDMMTGILKLNKEQKKEVRSIMDEGQKQAEPLREQLAKSREAIEESIASGKNQGEIDNAVKAYAAVEAQMTRVELESFAKIYKLLDGDQKAKSAPVFQMMAGIFNNKNWNEA